MGLWHVRTVGVLVVAVLAGGPAAALLCDALCSDAPHATPSGHTSGGTSHHHAPATGESALHGVHPGDHAAARHDHHHSAAEADVPPEVDTRLNASLGRECCDGLGQPRVSLSAGRADDGLLSALQAAVGLPADLLDPLDRRVRAPIYAPPPRPPAPARATLVLRI